MNLDIVSTKIQSTREVLKEKNNAKYESKLINDTRTGGDEKKFKHTNFLF